MTALRRLLAWVLATAVWSLLPCAAVVVPSSHAYDVPAIARIDVQPFGYAEVSATQLSELWEASASPSVEARGASTTPIAGSVATEAVDDLVRFDPGCVSRQIVGWNLRGSTGCAATPGVTR